MPVDVTNELGIFAQCQRVARLVRDLVRAAEGREPKLDEHLILCIDTLTAAVADALCTSDDALVLRRLRQVGFLVDETRHASWVLFDLAIVPEPLFDEVMHATAICRRVVDSTYAAARRSAYRRVVGLEP